MGFIPDSETKSHAPKKAAAIPGIPNFNTIFLSACLPSRKSLKKLFRRWTIAVRATATSTGKKIANTGSKSVPSPKPENSVKPDAIRAEKQITKYSIKSSLNPAIHELKGLSKDT
jgi:hypothetical protein